MKDVPDWAFVMMWISTLVGAYFLTMDAVKRFGHH